MADDYRNAKSSKEKPEPKRKANSNTIERWWELTDEHEIARAVVDGGTSMLQRAGDRHAAMIRHGRLYENCEFNSLSTSDYAASAMQAIFTGAGLMSLNVGASCVDTLLAKVTKNRPRPSFQCSGASWPMQIKGRALDKWCRGFFYETKVYQEARPVALDAYEFGTGLLQVFPTKGNKLMCERTMPNEILVDDLDGQYGRPSQMTRVKNVSRDVLTRLFPKYAEEIREASKESDLDQPNSDPEIAENTLRVWESWHLPSGEGARDGKHVIAIDGCVLFQEEWKICQFPFVVMRFKRRTSGFFGKGVIETVAPIQVEINKTVRSISRQMHRKGKGRIFVPLGSKVPSTNLTNNDGADVIMFAGDRPPTVDNSNAIAPEEFQYVLQLYRQAFQECGISEMAASAKKPSGLDAAVALREMSDIESERFAPQHQDWEQFFLDYAELAIELITKQYGWSGYKVLVPGRRDLLEVDWANVNLKRDDYVMQMFPTSSLPQTPAARFQRVEELRAKGYITDPQAKRLLNFPDIEAEENLGNAMIDDVDATISHILDDDTPKLMPLEPYQNLDLIIERATASYLYARHRDCPEDRLQLLRNLIDNAAAAKVAMMQTPPPAPMMPGAPMGGPGMGAPTGAPPAGGPQISNEINVPPPIIPTVPPVIPQ